MVAVALLHGAITAECYQDEFARDPRIDALRAKMRVTEEPRFTAEYYDPEKRAVGNSVQVFFEDGTATAKASVDYPVGHRRRRREGIPLLERKFQVALATRYPPGQAGVIRALFMDQEELEATPVNELLDRLVVC